MTIGSLLGSLGRPGPHGGGREGGEVTVTIVTTLKMAQAFWMSLAALFFELERDVGRPSG